MPYLPEDRVSVNRTTPRPNISPLKLLHSLVRHGLHELIDEVIVFFASNPLVLQSDVQGVVK